MLYKPFKAEFGRYINENGEKYSLTACKHIMSVSADGFLLRDSELGYKSFKTEKEAAQYFGLILIESDDTSAEYHPEVFKREEEK